MASPSGKSADDVSKGTQGSLGCALHRTRELEECSLLDQLRKGVAQFLFDVETLLVERSKLARGSNALEVS